MTTAEKTDSSKRRFFLYFSGINYDVADDLSRRELLPYRCVGFLNFLISLLIFPFVYIFIQGIMGMGEYDSKNNSVNPIVFIPVSLISFILYCYLRRYFSSLYINNINKWSFMVPFIIVHTILSLVSILLLSFAVYSKISDFKTAVTEKKVSVLNARLHMLDSLDSVSWKKNGQVYQKYNPGIHHTSPHYSHEVVRVDTTIDRFYSKKEKASYPQLWNPLLQLYKRDSVKIALKADTLNKEIEKLNGGSRAEKEDYGIFYILLVFFSGIFFACPVIIFRSRKDIYHEILKQNELVATKYLDERKSEIINRIGKQAEIGQTLQALNELNKMAAPSPGPYLQGNYYDLNNPDNLEGYADYQNQIGAYEKALEIYNDALRLNPEKPELWKKKADTLLLLKKDIEYVDALNKYASLVRSINFKENLNFNIFIKSVRLQNTSFYGNFNWELKSNINVLLGKNGFGKSHLLSIIAAMVQEDSDSLKGFRLFDMNTIINRDSSVFIISGTDTIETKEEDKIFFKILLNSPKNEDAILKLTSEILGKQNEYDKIRLEIAQKLPSDAEKRQLDTIEKEIKQLFDKVEALRGRITFSPAGIEERFGKVSILAIPDLRFVTKSTQYTTKVTDDKAKNLIEYGAYHFINQISYEDAIQNFLTIICNRYLKNNTDDEIFRLINRVFKRLTGNEFIWSAIIPSEDYSSYKIMVKTDGNEDDLPIQKVSQGTISIISVFGLIYNYLTLRYPDLPGNQALKKHCIIIIDEIDAHLHPSWQQKIISLLREEFPGVQFIISAHSPLIVAGCKEGEVSVLRRNTQLNPEKKETGNKGFVIETIEKNMIGMPIADIFQLVFGIEEKDEAFLDVMALMPFRDMIKDRHKELSQKNQLTKDEDSELNKLAEQMSKLIYADQISTLSSSKDQLKGLKNKYEITSNENLRLQKENDELKLTKGKQFL